MGGRAFAFERIEPYSGDVAALTQQLVYGRDARSGEEPFILEAQFHIQVLYLPFALIPDATLARSIFTLILELSLGGFLALSLISADWKGPGALSAAFLLAGFSSYYSILALHEANPVLLLGLIYAGILVSLKSGMDEVAGALLALCLSRWEIGAPFIILILLRVWAEGRSRVFAGLFMATFILVGISLLLYPDWLIPYLRAVVNNLKVEYGFSIFGISSRLFPSQGESAAWILVLALVILLGYEWSSAREADFTRFYWIACVTLAATPFLGFRSELENLAVLIMPVALVLSVVRSRWRKQGAILSYLILLVYLVAPWSFHLLIANQYGKITQDVIYLFMPVSTLVGLYWIRWWLLHPPRTWMDQAMS
jgi:hypothetical protein